MFFIRVIKAVIDHLMCLTSTLSSRSSEQCETVGSSYIEYILMMLKSGI